MNILVCIKQVPGTNKVEIDAETGVLKRDGVESKINPYDLYAIETALWIKAQLESSVTVSVITMGPPQAERIIREAYMMGVDQGYLVSDRRFAGADVLATSYALYQAIKSVGSFDLILCGKQTTDGDTAQVGPALAEHLSIPHAAWVKSIFAIDEMGIEAEQDLADSTEKIRMEYPCLITVEKGIHQPRLPSYKLKRATVDRLVQFISLEQFEDQNPQHYGLSGSPTKVEKIFPPVCDTNREMIEEAPEEAVRILVNLLKEKKFI